MVQEILNSCESFEGVSKGARDQQRSVSYRGIAHHAPGAPGVFKKYLYLYPRGPWDYQTYPQGPWSYEKLSLGPQGY